MRPLGTFPDWASASVPSSPPAIPSVGFIPATEDPDIANFYPAQFKQWFYRDGYELLNWGERYQLDIIAADVGADTHWNTPDDYWRHSAIGYSQGLYIAGVRNHGDPAQGCVLWSRDGRFWERDGSITRTIGTPDYSFYSVCMTPEQNVLAWLQCVVGAYASGTAFKYYIKTEYNGPPIPNGDFVEIFPSAGSVWENAVWSPQDARFYCIGWNINDTPSIARLMFVDLDGTTNFWTVDNVPTNTKGLHVAVSETDRVVAGSDDLWWGQSATSEFRHVSAATLFDGQILGLIYAETDKVFVLVTEKSVWTSPNGVQWTRALSYLRKVFGGRFMGPVVAVGGSCAVLFRQYTTGSQYSYALLVSSNAMRDWTEIQAPTNSDTDIDLSVAGIYTAGKRAMIVNNRPQGGVRYSLA